MYGMIWGGIALIWWLWSMAASAGHKQFEVGSYEDFRWLNILLHPIQDYATRTWTKTPVWQQEKSGLRLKGRRNKKIYARMKYACLNCASLEVDCSWNQTTATNWYAVWRSVCAIWNSIPAAQRRNYIFSLTKKGQINENCAIFIYSFASALLLVAIWLDADENEPTKMTDAVEL